MSIDITSSRRRPDFVGVGMQKAGTSWLYECLLDHPEIWGPQKKEIRYFDNERNFAKGEDWYLKWFSDAPGDAVLGEFTPGYSANPQTAERICEFSADISLLVLLRDPVKRTLSQIRHYVRNGNIDATPESGCLAFRRDMLSDKIRIRSKYTETLPPFFEYFDPEQIHVQFFEHLCEDPVQVVQEVYRFLGVDTDYEPRSADRKIGGSYVPRFEPVEQLKRALMKSLSGHNAIGYFIDKLRRSWLSRLYTRINGQKLSLKLDDQQRTWLYDEFEEEYEELDELIGKSTPWTKVE